MRRLALFVLVALLVLIINGMGQTNFSVEDPVLITSAGQSADILMVKILAKKANLEFTLDKMATPDKLTVMHSVMVVCGGSTKGLGAAKIDKKQEYDRIEKLLKAARKQNIPIIAVHVGGKSRRGALSDYFNKLVAEQADYIIVVENGNQDGFFTKIAKAKNITLDTPEKIMGIQKILKRIYQKDLKAK